MKKLFVLLTLPLVSLLLISCGQDEVNSSMGDFKEQTLSENQIMAASGVLTYEDGRIDFAEGDPKDLNYLNELRVDNIGQNYKGSIHYITGEITNISDSMFNELIQMIIFNENGNVEKIQYVPVKVDVGETMYFEEIVGENRPGVEVLLQEL